MHAPLKFTFHHEWVAIVYYSLIGTSSWGLSIKADSPTNFPCTIHADMLVLQILALSLKGTQNYYFLLFSFTVSSTEGLTATCAAAFGFSLPSRLKLDVMVVSVASLPWAKGVLNTVVGCIYISYGENFKLVVFGFYTLLYCTGLKSLNNNQLIIQYLVWRLMVFQIWSHS